MFVATFFITPQKKIYMPNFIIFSFLYDLYSRYMFGGQSNVKSVLLSPPESRVSNIMPAVPIPKTVQQIEPSAAQAEDSLKPKHNWARSRYWIFVASIIALFNVKETLSRTKNLTFSAKKMDF